MKEEPVNNSVMTVKDESGNIIECEILFTFRSEETKKDYVVYTDNSLTEDGQTKVYANVYEKNGNSKVLSPVETEEEWNTIESILAKLEQEENGSGK